MEISIIMTPSQGSLAADLLYRICLTGGVRIRKRTQSTAISPVQHTAYSDSHHIVPQQKPVVPWGEMSAAGGCHKRLARLLGKML